MEAEQRRRRQIVVWWVGYDRWERKEDWRMDFVLFEKGATSDRGKVWKRLFTWWFMAIHNTEELEGVGAKIRE